MSVYSRFPLPLVAYSILHSPRRGANREEYEATMLEMHARVEEESVQFTGDLEKSVAGLSARQAQILRGALSPFLQTPIMSDDAEVRKIFRDGFDALLAQVADEGPAGAICSWAGRAELRPAGTAWRKKLESGGRRYASALGLQGVRGVAGVYESVYVVKGGVNLDVLEHIVRDRLGIYTSPHGTHIAATAPFAIAAHNLVHAAGADYWKSLAESKVEAALFFDKGAIPYDSFRASLSSAIDGALAGSGAPASTLWQRKLGLGKGCEFVLRFLAAGGKGVQAFIDGLRESPSPFAGKDAGARNMGLLVKDLMHPRRT